jgi:hypothetical protein
MTGPDPVAFQAAEDQHIAALKAWEEDPSEENRAIVAQTNQALAEQRGQIPRGPLIGGDAVLDETPPIEEGS